MKKVLINSTFMFSLTSILLLLTQCGRPIYYNFDFKQTDFDAKVANDTPNVIIEAVSPIDESQLTGYEKKELAKLVTRMDSELIFKKDSIKVIRYNYDKAPKRELFESNVESREVLENLKSNDPEKINRAKIRAIIGFSLAMVTLISVLIPAIIPFSGAFMITGFIYSVQGLKARERLYKRMATIGTIVGGLYVIALALVLYVAFTFFN